MARPAYALRPAVRADLPALAAADPLLQTDPARAAHVGDLLDLGMSWLAEAEGGVAGFLVMSDHFFARPFVDLLVVAQDHRRRGVGGQLLARAEASHRDDRVFTSTNESNGPMRALLVGRDWKVSGIIENLDPGDPEIVFVKFSREGDAIA